MIEVDISQVVKSFENLNARIEVATEVYANVIGEKMVSYAKQNAPWNDITGLSRQTIDKQVTTEGNSTVVLLRGNTAHFKYLELANEKKYAILFPTLIKHQNEVAKGWKSMIGGI